MTVHDHCVQTRCESTECAVLRLELKQAGKNDCSRSLRSERFGVEGMKLVNAEISRIDILREIVKIKIYIVRSPSETLS